MIAACFGVGIVERAGEQGDGTVVIDGAHHMVEVHRTVEEPPRHVTHQRPQESVNRHDMVAGGKTDVCKISVTTKTEATGAKGAIAG